MQQMRPAAPMTLVTSERLGWSAMTVSFERIPPIEATLCPEEDDRIVVHRNVAELELKDHRQWKQKRSSVGSMHLIPRGTEATFALRDTFDTQTIIIPRRVIEEVAAEFLPGDPARIAFRHGIYLPPPEQLLLIKSIGEALLCGDEGSTLYAEYAARALAAQLVIAAGGDRVRLVRPMTPRHPRAVTRALEFMQDNLDRKVTLDMIARATSSSISVLTREFRAELGVTPHQVLISLRIRMAKRLLRAPGLSIAHAAVAAGFSSQEHLARVFRRHVGVTPSQYRNAFIAEDEARAELRNGCWAGPAFPPT